MLPNGPLSAEQLEAQLEALDRLVAVRVVTDAMIVGHWRLSTDVLDRLGALLAAAGRWAERAAA